MEKQQVFNEQFLINLFGKNFEKVWVSTAFDKYEIGILHKGIALKYNENVEEIGKIVHLGQFENWCNELRSKFIEAYEKIKDTADQWQVYNV